jgi:hypothetical protein
MSRRTLGRLALLLALISLVIACAPRAATIPAAIGPARDTVVISEAPYGAYVGRPVTLGARVWRDGSVVPDASVEWTAAPAQVARIAGDGTLIPLDAGHVVITARAGKVVTRRTLLVLDNRGR